MSILIIKQSLTMIGAALPRAAVSWACSTANYLAVGRWMREHEFTLPKRVHGRTAVWQYVADRVAQQRVLYLEFGVYQGDSIRWWAGMLKHPEAVLVGFDSFEGLPEAGGPWTEGQFDVQGRLPIVNDSRVRFEKGWFSETLRTFVPPPHDVLVVNIDADLYASTKDVFSAVRPWIREGTYVYFDEFNHLDHEARAFGEFLAASGIRFEAVCADETLNYAAFRCTRIGSAPARP
ncbi:MAG: TylF/MycF family methyltransferase [Phycisphaerales bacterium]|nr:TylF/MycF family methyltransferase [Phycisphaerales bacterium]